METDHRTARQQIVTHCGSSAVSGDLASPAPPVAPDRHRWPQGWDAFAARLVEMAPIDPDGRIWFPGNPYPLGHKLERATITAQLGSETLRLIVELGSDYYPDSSDAEDPDDLNGLRAWQSVGVWANYNACSFGGTVVRTPEAGPLDLTQPVTFVIDPLDRDLLDDERDDLAFWQCYILGHDSIADHRLELVPNGDGTFQLQWAGRVAMTYSGSYSLDHFFWVEHAALPAIRFVVDPRETSEAEARTWLAQYVVHADKYEFHDGVFEAE